jgi:hypothetical protein
MPRPEKPRSAPGDDTADKPAPGPSGNAAERKAVNDSVAYLRGLAELRGRNVDWAERAVRDGASLPASDALEAKVIDLIAKDLPDLLQQIEMIIEVRNLDQSGLRGIGQRSGSEFLELFDSTLGQRIARLPFLAGQVV